MTMRKTLDDLKSKLSNLSPEERISGLVLVGIDTGPEGEIIVASRSYIPFGKNGGEAWQEEYPVGDPRRVKWEKDQ
ncbi:hypothetical protein [Tatumella sp. UBA2305]|uniref:hypothetical protein n=1 Tax=Tatumella sp. UBA2305 TaxID=1947647 RepID=UPI0025D597C3|nr:hypothetical protein [Tatumella sp. UBA2305]